jgi:hypothetical protein
VAALPALSPDAGKPGWIYFVGGGGGGTGTIPDAGLAMLATPDVAANVMPVKASTMITTDSNFFICDPPKVRLKDIAAC